MKIEHKFFFFTDQQWLNTTTTISMAGGQISNNWGRLEISECIETLLNDEREMQRYLDSMTALNEAGDLAHRLCKAMSRISDPEHRATIVGFSGFEDYKYEDADKDFLKQWKVIRELSRNARLPMPKAKRSGRPKDRFTARWCGLLSREIEEHCSVPLRIRGRVNPGMVDVLHEIWMATKPVIGGRDHRRAIQLALSKLPERKPFQNPLREERNRCFR